MNNSCPDSASCDPSLTLPASIRRVSSIDALRGLVMFVMIFVNDIAGVTGDIVPRWMRHNEDGRGMTFVDLVFPAFLFIVGMSIPIALSSRLAKGEPVWKIWIHVIIRVLCLLFIGIMIVNGQPDAAEMGWSAALWCVLMYVSAIFAFCSIKPARESESAIRSETIKGDSPIFVDTRIGTVPSIITIILRAMGFALLVYLAFVFRGKDGYRIISLSPFSIHTLWFGALGRIGWAYLIASIAFLVFRNHRTALLGCTVLLFCIYAADRTGAFESVWKHDCVFIGEIFGSLAAICMCGMLLATILLTPETISNWSRAKFTALFIAGCSIGGYLVYGLYGINKPLATPTWCLCACAVTSAIWLLFYYLCDILKLTWFTRPFSIAGQNVFLAYLLSYSLDPALEFFGLDYWYSSLAQPDLSHVVVRSIGCAVVILSLTAMVNRLGFRLKL
jgi:heparan-alpha-glucosaminide N-acetyltransferase